MKKKGFTLIELLVVIAIIAMLLAILMPALNKVKKIAQRVVCGTNLKGLGTAQTVYANDYEDQYTLQGQGTQQNWNGTAGTDQFQRVDKVWADGQNITVGASLYLLVREADVSPKSFICPSSTQTAYDGRNANNLDLVELWDFGHPGFESTGPANCVSYALHQPYRGNGGNADGAPGNRAANATKNASFAVMADRNPFMDPKLQLGGAPDGSTYVDKVINLQPDWDGTSRQKWEIMVANSQPHDRDGQNVTYGDGHSSYEKRSDVGEQHDNIYVPQHTSLTPISNLRQGAWVEQNEGFSAVQAPISSTDSLLVNDSFTTR